jgi:hypothetical protein
MSADTGIVVHPASDLTYASLVLEGFARRRGVEAIRYSTEGFPPGYAGGRMLAYYPADAPSERVSLVFTDQTTVYQRGKKWSRLYGMVNVADGQGGRVVALGPTFGVRVSSNALVRRHLAHTWRWATERSGTRPPFRGRLRIAAERSRALVKHQRQRAPIDAYAPRPSDADYVFFTAWPWAKHPEVNPPRIRFIEACRRAPGLTFEGGFAPRRRNDIPEVLPYTAAARYSLPDYLAAIGRSALVFNNPAVHGCLGWKLGEFLAMGKAIVSLPLDRVLPAPLEHGVHLHIVDGTPESLDDAIARLRSDTDYRRALEANARRWYEEHLAPERIAARLELLLEAT